MTIEFKFVTIHGPETICRSHSEVGKISVQLLWNYLFQPIFLDIHQTKLAPGYNTCNRSKTPQARKLYLVRGSVRSFYETQLCR